MIPATRRYLSRAFGFTLDGIFIEGNYAQDQGVAALDVDGRFTPTGAAPVEYDSIPDLIAKLHWGEPQVKVFTDRLNRILHS